jgi:hypothetical protein
MSRILPEFSCNTRELNTERLTEGGIGRYASPTTAELPSLNTKRWVARRKAAVVTAVRNGKIGLEEACRRYELSKEEFLAWERGIENNGVPGLRITRVQIYRNAPGVRQDNPKY